MEKTYILKVDVQAKGEPAEMVATFVEHMERDVKDTCNRNMKDAEIRIVSLILHLANLKAENDRARQLFENPATVEKRKKEALKRFRKRYRLERRTRYTLV